MSIVLAIETSSSEYYIALGAEGTCLFNSADHQGLNKNKDLGLLLRTGLEKTCKAIKDIEAISINIGPGGLGAVRSGVSFANGLSYGLVKPLLPLNAFELTGFEASKNTDLPVITTSNAADGNAYGGLYLDGKVTQTVYGPLADIARDLTKGLDKCLLSGTHQDKLSDILSDVECVISGIRFASAVTQIEFSSKNKTSNRLTNEPVGALNELSEMFNAEDSR